MYGAGRVPRCQISSISKSNRRCILADDLHALSGYDSTGVKDSEAWCVWERRGRSKLHLFISYLL